MDRNSSKMDVDGCKHNIVAIIEGDRLRIFSEFFVHYKNKIKVKHKMAHMLSLKATTWYKDSHSLYDYESTKITENHYELALPEKHVGIFRKKNSNSIHMTHRPEVVDVEEFDMLSYIKLKEFAGNVCRMQFTDFKEYKSKNKKSQRLNTDESNESCQLKEEAYIVVSKVKDDNGAVTGWKLNVGQMVKLGRVEYFVSEILFGGVKKSAVSKNRVTTYNRNSMKFNAGDRNKEGNSCKICLQEIDSQEDFLFNPCKCAGSCGTVHIGCLQHWIQIKVKKQTIGGTTHFNFQKFQCEVCRAELPMVVDTGLKQIQLLPIEKPLGNYLILEAACQKTKSVMIIQNPSVGGIKLGRGHECEIRITDISVSRNHAVIKENPNGFYIFDNKSKFGTLIRDENQFNLEVGNYSQAIQIGRTLIDIQVKPAITAFTYSKRV